MFFFRRSVMVAPESFTAGHYIGFRCKVESNHRRDAGAT